MVNQKRPACAYWFCCLFLKAILTVGKIKPEGHLTSDTLLDLKVLFFSLQYMHAEGPPFYGPKFKYLPYLLGCPGVSGGMSPWFLKRCPGVFRGTMTTHWSPNMWQSRKNGTGTSTLQNLWFKRKETKMNSSWTVSRWMNEMRWDEMILRRLHNYKIKN